MPGPTSSSSPAVSPVRRRRPWPPGKSVDATSSKWTLTELGELVEAALEILSLHAQFGECLLLPFVLLGGERVDPPEFFAPARELVEPVDERLSIVSLGRLSAGRVQAALGFLALGVHAGELDVNRSGRSRGLARLAPNLGLRSAEPAKLCRELTRSGRAGVGPGTKRRLPAVGGGSSGGQRAFESLGDRDQRPVTAVVRIARRSRLVHDRLGLPLERLHLFRESSAPGLELQQDGLSRLSSEPDLTAIRVVGDTFPGHCQPRLGEEVIPLDDRELVHPVFDHDVEAAEASSSGFVNEA